MTRTHSLIAFNTATASENKIHDDTVASRFGFTGGLVPGVDVFAYLAHAPMAKWGMDWLRGGQMRARFLKPVYDGDTAEVSATDTADGLDLVIKARDDLCATGSARLQGSKAPDSLLPVGLMPDPDARPPASMASRRP